LIASGQDSLHCIPLEESRSLHQIAAGVIKLEEQLQNRGARIIILENRLEKQHFGFSEQLKIEREKADLRTEMFDHATKINDSYLEENKGLKKKVRNLKWQRAGLGVLVIVVTLLSL
jgi:hypothetical protein